MSQQYCRLFVGGVSPKISPKDVRHAFEKYGEVVDVDVNTRGFAFVTMSDRKEADRAVRKLNATSISGCRVGVSCGVVQMSPLLSSVQRTPTSGC